MTYCIDTCSLIAAWSERYPVRNFPRFWDHLEALVLEGRLFSPEEVRLEVKRKSNGLGGWLDERREMFVQLELDIQESARDILQTFPELTKQLPGRNSADPFVIALAKIRSSTVVTEEGLGSVKRPKIPLVCNHFGIECINLLALVQREDWVI